MSRKQKYTKEQYNRKLQRQREQYHTNPSFALLRSRKYNLKRYGLTLEDYISLLNSQGNKCAICGGSDSRALNVDHDHQTGRIRGLLCTKCNTALGLLDEDTCCLRAALKYLEGSQ